MADPMGLCPPHDKSCHYVCYGMPGYPLVACNKIECTDGKCKNSDIILAEFIGKSFNFVGKFECHAFEQMERDERRNRGLPFDDSI